MKALLCKSFNLILVFALAGSIAQAKEVKKSVKKEFKTNSSTTLIMETSFCELNVDTWDQNLATFDVTMVAEHNNAEKADKILALMSVTLKQDGNQIYVETELDDKFKKGDWGKTKNMKFIIQAKVPASIGFVLENSFGEVVISHLTGEVSIESNYGALAIKSLDGKNNDLELNYGETRIGSVNSASIECNYGDLSITECNNLDLEINFGHCSIERAVNVIGEVSMGELEIDEVSADFEVLSLEASTGSIAVGINKNAGFTLNAETHMSEISLPELDEKVINKEGMGTSVKGTYGHGKSKVNLEASLGDIKIKLR